MNTPIPPSDSANWNIRFVDACKLRKLSNKEVALGLGISVPAVIQWENGSTKELTFENGLKISAFLGVRPEWLRFGNEPMEPSDVKDAWSISKAILDDVSSREKANTHAKEKADATVGKRTIAASIATLIENSSPATQSAMLALCKMVFVMEEEEIAPFVQMARGIAANGTQGTYKLLKPDELYWLEKWHSATLEQQEFAFSALAMPHPTPEEDVVPKKINR